MTTAFSDNPGFKRIDRPQPGPGAVAFAAEFTTGRTQKLSRNGKVSRSCAVVAEVEDPDAIHDAVNAVVFKALDARFESDSSSRAVRRSALIPEGQKAEIISSRLKPGDTGTLHQLGGNVRVIIYTEVDA